MEKILMSLTSGYRIDAPETRDRVIQFLNEIGVLARYENGATGFAGGCRIDQGALAVDPACRISTILHEAGHLAITPGCFRSLMDDNLYAGQRAMLEIIEEAGLHPEAPLYRAVMQCSDPEATAWAWAAGTELLLPGEEIIRGDEYDGAGEAIRAALQMRAYIGVHGLCAIRDRAGVAGWPRLFFWTQEAGFPASASAEL